MIPSYNLRIIFIFSSVFVLSFYSLFSFSSPSFVFCNYLFSRPTLFFISRALCVHSLIFVSPFPPCFLSVPSVYLHSHFPFHCWVYFLLFSVFSFPFPLCPMIWVFFQVSLSTACFSPSNLSSLIFPSHFFLVVAFFSSSMTVPLYSFFSLFRVFYIFFVFFSFFIQFASCFFYFFFLVTFQCVFLIGFCLILIFFILYIVFV